MTTEQNPLSGLQLQSLHGLLVLGVGLKAPTMNTTVTTNYEAIPTVASFKSLVATAEGAGLSASDLALVKALGASSIPALFGSVPAASSSLPAGPVVASVTAANTALFPPGVGPSIFTQVFAQAQGYASISYDVLKSAATTTFGSFQNPDKLLSGGLTNIVSSNTASLEALGLGILQSGDSFNVNTLDSAFSAAGTLKPILDSGNDYVGNLQSKVLGEVLTDSNDNPVRTLDGEPIIVTREFIDSIISNPPVSVPDVFDVTPAVMGAVKDNQLDELLSSFVAKKVVDPTEITAMASFSDLGGTAATAKSFSELVDPKRQLGPAAAVLSSTNPTEILGSFNTSVGGMSNLTNTDILADVCRNIEPLSPSLTMITGLTKPLSYDELAGLITAMGPGSGPYGNALTSDFFGMDISNALKAVTNNMTTVAGSASGLTITADMNVLNGIIAGGPLVAFSDAYVPSSVSDAIAHGSTLINSTGTTASSYASANGLSANLSTYANAVGINNKSAILYEKATIDTSTLKKNISSLVGFVSSLHSVATDTTLGSAPVIQAFADRTVKSGQAILATQTEGKNLAILRKAGLKPDNFSSVTADSSVLAGPPGSGGGGNPPGGGIGIPPGTPPTPNPAATVPVFLSVKIYKPAGSSLPQIEIRYEGLTTFAGYNVWVVWNSTGDYNSGGAIELCIDPFPVTTASSGIIVADFTYLPAGSATQPKFGISIVSPAGAVAIPSVTPPAYTALLTSDIVAWPPVSTPIVPPAPTPVSWPMPGTAPVPVPYAGAPPGSEPPIGTFSEVWITAPLHKEDPQIMVQDMPPGVIIAVPLVIPSGTFASMRLDITMCEYQAPPTFRQAAISRTPGDFSTMLETGGGGTCGTAQIDDITTWGLTGGQIVFFNVRCWYPGDISTPGYITNVDYNARGRLGGHWPYTPGVG